MHVRLLRVASDLEAEFTTHLQHRGVLAQHLAFDRADAFSACIVDDRLHQQPAEAVALEVRADEDGVFAAFVGGVRMQTHHAEHFAG